MSAPNPCLQFVTNLLTVPSSVVHIFTLLAITWLSERFRERTIFAMAQNLWSFPCLIALRVWPGLVKDVWGTYALVTVLLSYPSSQAIMVGWLSKNSNNVGTRSVSVAFSNSESSISSNPPFFSPLSLFCPPSALNSPASKLLDGGHE